MGGTGELDYKGMELVKGWGWCWGFYTSSQPSNLWIWSSTLLGLVQTQPQCPWPLLYTGYTKARLVPPVLPSHSPCTPVQSHPFPKP